MQDIHLQPQEGALWAPLQNTDRKSTRRVELDATTVFQPCARRAARLFGLDPSVVHLVDLHNEIADKTRRYRARFEQVLVGLRALVAAGVKLRFLALACHGWLDGTQLVPGAYLAEFVSLLTQLAHPDGLIIALWAGSTADAPDGRAAEGPGGARGFAYRLWLGLTRAGVRARVTGHPIAGHALFNPQDVLFWDGDDAADGIGDIFVRWPHAFGPRDPGDPLFPEFRGLMRHTTLCYELPFLTPAVVHERVVAAARTGGVGRTGEVDPRAFGMRNLETALALLGFDPGDIDGVRDDATTTAIKAFQVAEHLDDDGIFGRKSAAAMLASLRARGVADARVFQEHARQL